ncbi:MAG TPA: hypothetical protein VK479_15015 [Micropepsaceae bacterium]|nr:hypothetical protein [Micropepsaceae bacterium]
MDPLIGLGVSIFFAFLRYRVPAVPKPLATGGMAIGILVMAAGFLPEPYKPTIAVLLLFLLGVSSLGAAGYLYWQHVAKRTPTADVSTPQPQQGQGGKGGSGEIFGNSGTIIGGRGGKVGPGGLGRGGDGGGGVIHGDGGTIIGGEGGSVDGTNIWYPPAQSSYIQFLESQGQTPDFNVQYPGAGGATAGWLERQEVVVKIREEYFKKAGQDAKVQTSKIEGVPLEYINEKLREFGLPWRARPAQKYWYLYYIPDTP